MILLVVLVLFSRFNDAESARSQFQSIPANTGCVCPGEVLTFYCTAVGTGNTRWSGTAFDCSAGGIILRHQRFNESGGVNGSCNNGALQAQSVSVENSCYTSQLNFTFIPSFNNKTVSCTHTSSVAVNNIGTSILLAAFEASVPPPNGIRLVRACARELTFMWTAPLDANCTAVTYGIFSDCGVCPNTTNTANVSCSIVQLSRSVFNCTFRVHSIICGTNSHPSEAIEATLKAPDVPRVRAIPLYSEQRVLLGFTAVIVEEEPFVIANGIFGNITGYNFYIISEKQSLTNNVSCAASVCKFVVNVQNSACAKSAKLNVTISADNVLGEGPVTDLLNVDCTNEFVMVKVLSDSALSCMFLDEFQTSEKTCSALYGPCDQTLTQNSSANATSGSATLNLELSDLGSAYCYILTATNGTYEIMIKGTIDVHGKSTLVAEIVAPVVVIAVLLILLVIVVILLLCIYRKRSMYNKKHAEVNIILHDVSWKHFTNDDVAHLKLQPVDLNEDWITSWKVEHATSLKEFIERKGLVYRRGCAFYEFTNSIERISTDKQLIFVEKGTKKYLRPITDPNCENVCEKKLMGETVMKPSLDKYDVYVQSTGSGTRHLSCDSSLLYVRLQPHPLWHVDQRQIEIEKIPKASTVKEICSDHGVEFIYVELNIKSCKYDKKSDVILQNVDTEMLLTGPFAHKLAKKKNTPKRKQQSDDDSSSSTDTDVADAHINRQQLQSASGDAKLKEQLGTPREDIEHKEKHPSPHGVGIDSEQYRIFVSTRNENLKLKEGTKVLYHKQQPVEERLIPISSDQFVTTKLSSDCTLGVFQQQHDLDTAENNVFVEMSTPLLEHNGAVLDVILMKDQQYFTGPHLRHDIDSLHSYDEKGWKIFILYSFKGDLNLRRRMLILYRANTWRNNGLIPIHTEHWQFEGKVVEEGQKFRRKVEGKHFMFLEHGSFQQGRENPRDVVLMDKCKKYFSGPYARRMIEDREHIEEDKWTIFVLKQPSGSAIKFKKESVIWCQKLKQKAQFHVLKVDDDNVRMSEYIQRKLSTRFENGKAFYELSEDEDLLYYKDVALLKKPKNKDKFPEEGEVTCEVFPLYQIPGTPGMNIKSTSTNKEKWFIQSLSQGSRCLRSGTLLLYKKTL